MLIFLLDIQIVGNILSCFHHDKTKARQEASALPGTCRGVVAGALLAIRWPSQPKPLQQKWASKPKPDT
nr:hypothetical protein [Tanacetum cinerariifolium]